MLGNLRLGTVVAAAAGAGVLLLAGAVLPEASGAREAMVPAGPLLASGETVVGERIVYRAGEAVLEAIDLAHNGRNIGDKPMTILAVFMGAEGLAPSRPAAP